MTEFFDRLPRAFVLALIVYLGLHWAGVGGAFVLAAVMAAVLSSMLHVFTGVAAPVAAVALLWGALVWVGVAPNERVAQAKIESLFVSERPQIQVASNSLSLEDKLTQLRTACEHNALSAKECEDARARIVSQFTSRP